MKKPDSLNKAAAEKLGLDLNWVKQANRFFWKEGVRRNLPQHTAVFVKNLGTIVISKHKISRQITKLIGKVRSTRKSTWLTDKRKALHLEVLYTDLRTLLARRNELANQYYKPPVNEQANRTIKTNTQGNGESSSGAGGMGQ